MINPPTEAAFPMGGGLKGVQCGLEVESSLRFSAGPNFAFIALGFALDLLNGQATRCASFPIGKWPKGCAMPSFGRIFVTVPGSTFHLRCSFGEGTAPEAPVETWISRREPRDD